MADAGEPDDGLTAYERLRAARIAANNEMMRRLRLPELGSELRPPSTPSASGAAGAAGAAGQYAPAKRRSPKGLPSPNATPKSRKREFRMVLRVRKEVNYAEVADDDPKQRLPSKVPRIDDSAGARGRAAATIDPDTKLENLDSKYANDLDARNRAIRSVALYHTDQPTWIVENRPRWRKLREKLRATREAKASAAAAASERRALAEYGSVGVGATRGAPGSASDDVADPEPSATPPTPAVSPAGGGARRVKRFTGGKEDPANVRGAAKFIALGVPLICSKCETEATSRWTASKADPNKPACRACYNRQLGATRGDCADCGIAGADAAEMLTSRFTDGAWLCNKCWHKEAPADRVCASCEKGVDTVSSWQPSKLIEGAPWLCNVCAKREAPADRVCASCEKGASTVKSWQPSKLIEGAPWLCYACYSRERTQILTDAGTTCGKCRSSKASSWRNSPDVPGGKICMKCWLEHDRALRKQKKQ